MLKMAKDTFKSLAVFSLQDFKSVSGHFSTLYMKELVTKKPELR